MQRGMVRWLWMVNSATSRRHRVHDARCRHKKMWFLWTPLVKKRMIYIVAQITLPRYSQTPHQFFASGHNTLFIRAQTADLSPWLAFCIALYKCKKSAVCLGVKKKPPLFLFLVSFLGLYLMTLYGISTTWCFHHPETLKRTYHDEEWLRIWLAVEDEVSEVRLSTSTTL